MGLNRHVGLKVLSTRPGRGRLPFFPGLCSLHHDHCPFNTFVFSAVNGHVAFS